jgi:hypothetical protein
VIVAWKENTCRPLSNLAILPGTGAESSTFQSENLVSEGAAVPPELLVYRVLISPSSSLELSFAFF